MHAVQYAMSQNIVAQVAAARIEPLAAALYRDPYPYLPRLISTETHRKMKAETPPAAAPLECVHGTRRTLLPPSA
jgi:hypothetical protein